MNILCIDYGTKRIGVAVATTPISQPLGIIPNTKNPRLSDVVTDQALEQIISLLREFAVEMIVVGISEGDMAEKTRHFIEKLKTRTTLPIEEVDETLTSVDAGSHMKHMKHTKRQGNRDHLAAAIMLQDYIDLHA
jgi:putative Holliday junction resolvase